MSQYEEGATTTLDQTSPYFSPATLPELEQNQIGVGVGLSTSVAEPHSLGTTSSGTEPRSKTTATSEVKPHAEIKPIPFIWGKETQDLKYDCVGMLERFGNQGTEAIKLLKSMIDELRTSIRLSEKALKKDLVSRDVKHQVVQRLGGAAVPAILPTTESLLTMIDNQLEKHSLGLDSFATAVARINSLQTEKPLALSAEITPKLVHEYRQFLIDLFQLAISPRDPFDTIDRIGMAEAAVTETMSQKLESTNRLLNRIFAQIGRVMEGQALNLYQRTKERVSYTPANYEAAETPAVEEVQVLNDTQQTEALSDETQEIQAAPAISIDYEVQATDTLEDLWDSNPTITWIYGSKDNHEELHLAFQEVLNKFIEEYNDRPEILTAALEIYLMDEIPEGNERFRLMSAAFNDWAKNPPITNEKQTIQDNQGPTVGQIKTVLKDAQTLARGLKLKDNQERFKQLLDYVSR